MSQGVHPARRQSPASAKRDEAIDALLKEHAPCQDHELLRQMMVTVCRLANDQAGRGELKIINTALRELRYAFKVFSPYNETHKVTIFGSARTPVEHPAYQAARAFAEEMERIGWMVITGAGDGIMRAGHHGARRDSSFGVAISLPFEQQANDIIANDPKLINFKYFFTRKLLFVKEAEAVALFPGGFGTQDEGFETLTLIQTGKADVLPIVMVDEPGGTYWSHWKDYVERELLGNGLISPEDMNLFKITDDIGEAANEITHFYKRYHSARMVRDNLVIRMKSKLSDEIIQQLNDGFSDILSEGTIHTADSALPEEGPEFADLPRLVLKFNRKAVGRLRLLIDAINDAD